MRRPHKLRGQQRDEHLVQQEVPRQLWRAESRRPVEMLSSAASLLSLYGINQKVKLRGGVAALLGVAGVMLQDVALADA